MTVKEYLEENKSIFNNGLPIIKTENTVNKKIEMLIDKYQSRLDDLEVLTEFTFEDGKREVLKSVIADLQSIME